MNGKGLTRRSFLGSTGAALGGSLLIPQVASAGQGEAPPSAPRPAMPSPAPAGSSEIRLDSNENPYGPSAAALAAMRSVEPRAARYPDSLEEPLIAAIARLHGVTPKQVALGCGSGELLRMADEAFLEPGRSLVVAEPTFEAVSVFAAIERARPIRVPLGADHRHDLKAMAAACDAQTGMVYVCNPNNPTGTIVTGAELSAFVKALPPAIVVLVDEAYHHFVEDPAYASGDTLVAAHPNVVVVRTFSKIYGLAGMRLGYAVGREDRIEAMRRRAMWSNANSAVLAAALASLDDPSGMAVLRRQMNDSRRWLCDALARDGRRFIPSHANFVMIDVGADTQPVIDALRVRRIFPGRKFPALPGWLRVSIGTRDEMKEFLAAFRQIVPAAATRAA